MVFVDRISNNINKGERIRKDTSTYLGTAIIRGTNSPEALRLELLFFLKEQNVSY